MALPVGDSTLLPQGEPGSPRSVSCLGVPALSEQRERIVRPPWLYSEPQLPDRVTDRPTGLGVGLGRIALPDVAPDVPAPLNF